MKTRLDDLLKNNIFEEHERRIKAEMTERCKQNIRDIQQKCAYEGESFSDWEDCYNASKEWLKNGTFIEGMM